LKAIKNFSYYSLGGILQQAMSFLLLPVYLVCLTPTEYGVISVITVSISVITVFTNLGAASGFYRLYYDGNEKRLFTTTLVWGILTSLLCFILIFYFSNEISNTLFKTSDYQLSIQYASLCIVISPLYELFMLVIRLKQEAKKYFIYSLVFFIFGFAFKFIFVAVLKEGVNGFWLAHVLSVFVGMAIVFSYGKIINLFSMPKISLLKQILKIGFPYTFSTLGVWVFESSDKLLLNFFLGPSVVGVYTLALKVSNLFRAILNNPVGLWWGPFAYNKALSKGIDSFKKSVKMFLNISSIAGSLGVVVLPLAALILLALPGHPEYKNALFLVPFCMIPQFLRLMQFPFAVQFGQAKKTKYAGYGGASTAIINLSINLLLIPLIGVWGAIISSTIGYFCWLIIYWYGGQKCLYIHYDWERVGKNVSLLLLYEITLIISLLFKEFFMLILAICSIVSIAIMMSYNYKYCMPFAIDLKNMGKGYVAKKWTALVKSE